MYLMGVRAHSRMSVCPTGSYCLPPVTSLVPLPGRASGGVGKKRWRSAELWDKELVTAHHTDPFARGSTPVDAGCHPPLKHTQKSTNKKAVPQTQTETTGTRGHLRSFKDGAGPPALINKVTTTKNSSV